MSASPTLIPKSTARRKSCVHQERQEVCRKGNANRLCQDRFFICRRVRRVSKRKTAAVGCQEGTRTRMPRTRRTPFVSRVLHDWNCPPAIPAVCSVAMRKDALSSLSMYGSLSFTAPLRSVLGRGFVLFRSGGKTSIQCATPAVLKEKECI